MAGKTLIGGTAYEVTGGKTLINGTAYSIAGGKTLVNGTAHDISFGVDLAELFRGMTVLRTNGRNSGSTGRITIEVVSNYLNTGETGYIFSFFNGYMSIAKIVCGTAGTQAIYQSSESYGNCWYALSYDAIWYHDTMNNGYNSKYGATLALVKFDQPEAKVDAVLSKLQHVNGSGRNRSSSDSIGLFLDPNTRDYSGTFIFCAYSGNLSVCRIDPYVIYNANYAPALLAYNSYTGVNNDIPNDLITVDNRAGENGKWWLGSSYNGGAVFYGGTMHIVEFVEQ